MRAVLTLLRADPLSTSEQLAERSGLAEPVVAQAIEGLRRSGHIRGRGWVLEAERPVVVVGAANMDNKATMDVTSPPGSSTPGHVGWNAGGVGRNIAEGLARYGTRVELIAAVGTDRVGHILRDLTADSGVGIGHLLSTKHPTGVYTAMLDAEGELLYGVSQMAAADSLTVRTLAPCRPVIGSADFLVLDANLPNQVLSWLLQFAAASGVQVLLDPVSTTKAARIATLISPAHPVGVLTPNVDELAAILGRDVPLETPALCAAAAELFDRGVDVVWVRRGPRGSVLVRRDEDGGLVSTMIDSVPTRVVDVTGAGDAMNAAFVHHFVERGDLESAARFGQAAAALTVEVRDSVRRDLTPAMVAARSTVAERCCG